MEPVKRSIISLLLLDVILALVILGLNGYTGSNISHRIVGQGSERLAQGYFGSGEPSGQGNQISFDRLKPGDILLGGNNGATYGQFTHAAIYQGAGLAWQGWLTTGVSTVPVSVFRTYDRACILRVKIDDRLRKKALRYAVEHRGRLFYPLVFKPGERIMNCTKLIWQAFLKQGVDLDRGNDIWVTPDNIYHSGQVDVIAQWGDIR
jgi:uncharacterized protein YycO